MAMARIHSSVAHAWMAVPSPAPALALEYVILRRIYDVRKAYTGHTPSMRANNNCHEFHVPIINTRPSSIVRADPRIKRQESDQWRWSVRLHQWRWSIEQLRRGWLCLRPRATPRIAGGVPIRQKQRWFRMHSVWILHSPNNWRLLTLRSTICLNEQKLADLLHLIRGNFESCLRQSSWSK